MSRAGRPVLVKPGELPAMEHLLGAYYHQDAWEDAATDNEIWELFISDKHPYSLQQLARELDDLLTRDKEAIHAFIQQNADAIYREEASGSKAWAESLKSWLAARNVV